MIDADAEIFELQLFSLLACLATSILLRGGS